MQLEQETMSLSEALAESKPHELTQQAASKAMTGSRPLSVAYDGQFWDVLYQGSPFGFDAQADLEEFLRQEGIDLQEGWRPEAIGAQS